MIDTLLPAQEFRFDGPLLEFGEFRVLSEPELDTLPSEIGGAVFRLYDVAEQQRDVLGGVMRQDEEPSLDPRNPLFENAGDETEAGMPVRDADADTQDPDTSPE